MFTVWPTQFWGILPMRRVDLYQPAVQFNHHRWDCVGNHWSSDVTGSSGMDLAKSKKASPTLSGKQNSVGIATLNLPCGVNEKLSFCTCEMSLKYKICFWFVFWFSKYIVFPLKYQTFRGVVFLPCKWINKLKNTSTYVFNHFIPI